MKIAALLGRSFRKIPKNEMKIPTSVIGSAFEIINEIKFHAHPGNFSNFCDDNPS